MRNAFPPGGEDWDGRKAAQRMSVTGQRVIQNVFYRLGGYAIGAGMQFICIVCIARYLGPEGFGHFAFILAGVGVFQLLADLGVRNVLIRDIAVDRVHFAERLGIARTLLWFLSLISLSLVVILANLFPLSVEVRQTTYIAGLAAIVTFHALGYGAVLRAFEEMAWDVLGFVLHKMVFLTLIGLLLGTHLGLRGVFYALLMANVCQCLYNWGLVRLRHGPARLSLDLRAAWAFLMQALPLGLAEILRRLTWQVDKLLLAALGSPVAVGFFSVAYKFLEVMNPLTLNVTLPLFPVLARLAQVSSDKVFDAYEQSLKFLFVMSIPLAVVLFVLSDRITGLFFGETYHAAAVVIRLLAPAVVLLVPTCIYAYIFTALGHQRLYMYCVALSLGINILLDLLLIPSYSYRGAAVGTLAAEASLVLSGRMALRRLGCDLISLGMVWRPVLAGFTLGSICWLVKEMNLASVVLGLLSGIVVYAGLLLVLQTFTRQEAALLQDALHIRLGRVI